MITTKKGKEGKARITFNSSFGMQVIAKRFDVLDGREFAQVYNEMQVLNGRDLIIKTLSRLVKVPIGLRRLPVRVWLPITMSRCKEGI